jgi:formate hydrogenlyase subunit 3/multisubunit Na+/H+ antiporter MnhD subunit
MKVPILIGGNRFKLTSNPKLPNRVSLAIFSTAFFFALMQTTYGKVGDTLEVTPFSRLFTLIFTAALILATIATTHRIPARANLKAPKDSDSENVATKKINALIDNRRQVDFHIILIMVGLGMSLMSMATHLFMLFVCIELASLSSYILVAWRGSRNEIFHCWFRCLSNWNIWYVNALLMERRSFSRRSCIGMD